MKECTEIINLYKVTLMVGDCLKDEEHKAEYTVVAESYEDAEAISSTYALEEYGACQEAEKIELLPWAIRYKPKAEAKFQVRQQKIREFAQSLR